MICTHVSKLGGMDVRSPLDALMNGPALPPRGAIERNFGGGERRYRTSITDLKPASGRHEPRLVA
jgi:hypothetical protein